MKKRYFYMSDINSTSTVIESTKKELLSIAVMLKEEAAFNLSNDDTISGYTKDGKFFYYDCTNFWDLKKSDIINAVSIVYSNESDTEVYGAYHINECGVVGPSDDGKTVISCELKEVDREDYREEQTAEELIEAVENLCARIDESIKEADQMIEEAENMMKEQAEEATAENFAPCFEIIKPHLFAKVEHVGENFPNRSECVYRLQGEDVALSIWIDAAFTSERLSRKFLDAWEAAGIVEERNIFEIAMENTMAQQKPRIHAGTMFYNPDADSLSNSALLENCFRRENLDKHSDILVTTSEQNNGAIALFYPPVCEKICELLHGAGFYVAFTSKNEGIVHKLDHLEVSAIRRNLQSTNRIFDPADTLTDEVFYYDPIIKRLIPESKTADFEVLRRQVLKGLA